jgi:hypothetical protein
MATFIRAAAHAASQVLSQQSLTCKRSHLTEIIAALLGYQTYAALTVEDAKSDPGLRLIQAENLILNLPLGALRAQSLQLPLAAVEACVAGLKRSIDAKNQGVHVSVSEFWIDSVLNTVSNHLYKDARVQSLMEGANWDHHIVETLFERQHESGSVWSSLNEWTIDAWGELQAEDEDHICLDAFGVIASLEFQKAGRAGVRLARVRLTPIPDYGDLQSSWAASA